MFKKIIFVCAALVMNSQIFAQVKFYTLLDKNLVGREQAVQLTYVIENAGSVEKFEPPAFPNFLLLQGPVESSGMTVVNGNMSQYTSLLFLLQPKTTGRIAISGAKAQINGKTMRSNKVFLDVQLKNVPNRTNPSTGLNLNLPTEARNVEREFYLRPGEDATEKIKKNLFVKAEVNKNTCFVNEPIVATYKLYSRLRSESRVIKRPSYNGFSVYDMIEPDGSTTTTETVDGKTYNVHIIRQSQLFPLQAGTFTLDPVEVENSVRFLRAPVDSDPDPFDDYFNSNLETIEQNITLASKPITITVEPLPAEKQPPGFDGAVGNFTMEAIITSDSLRQGEAAVLQIKIKGKGNLPIINAPQINWPQDIEAFDPTTEEEINRHTIPISGEKIFKYSFTPKKSGPIEIDPILFSFFDPSSKTYKTDSSNSLLLQVKAGASTGKSAISETQKKSGSGVIFNSTVLLSIFGLVVAALIALWIVGRKSSKKREQSVRKEDKEISQPQIPIDPLKPAKELLAAGNVTNFLKEIERVIWQESGKKLGLPSTLMNQSRVMNEFKQRQSPVAADLFCALVNDCESNLYIPGQNAENLQDTLNKAEQFMEELEKLK